MVIQCAIKHRFTDFIVNEIDEAGQVVWFHYERDLQKWKKGAATQDPKPEEAAKDEQEESKAEPLALEEAKLKEFQGLVSAKEYKRFSEYLDGINDGSIEKASVFTFEESIEDKNLRSAIHMLFKSTPLFETDTLMEGDSRRIRVFLKNGLSANKRRKLNIVTRKPQEEKEQPQYLQVVIQKTNIDTMQAIHYIAKRVKKYGKHFQIAGNKDKRGVTT